jgi:hypothetical protein
VTERRANEGLPVAISTVGGFFATLLVLLAGTANGTRPWVLLMRAAAAFLVVSGFLKILTACLIQVIQWRKTAVPAKRSSFADDLDDTIETIAASASSPHSKPKGAA